MSLARPRGLLVALVVFACLISLTSGASADVVGSGEIATRYEQLPPTIRSELGARVGGVVATAGGAKQVYQRGAILWHPDTGANPVMYEIWTKYKALGAETSPLGFPEDSMTGSTEEFQHAYQEFQLGTMVSSSISGTFAVYGLIWDVWNKNTRQWGPLGMPRNDPRVTSYTTWLGGYPITLTATANQTFQGATLDFSYLRPLLGSAAWIVQVNQGASARMRADMPMTFVDGSARCAMMLTSERWVHSWPGTSTPQPFVARLPRATCATTRALSTELTIAYDLTYARGLTVSSLQWVLWRGNTGMTAGTSASFSVAPGQEKSHTPYGSLVNPNGGSVAVNRITIRHTAISASDIKL